MDGIYYSTLIITDYARENYDLLLKNIIEINNNINISIFYEKQDNYKTIKDLTYHIGNVGTDLKTYGENRQDSDIAAFTYNDAKYIRKEIQVNNEELYFLYIYITIFSKDKKELEYLLNKISGVLQGKNMQNKKAYFRQDDGFKSCLPIMDNPYNLKINARRNVLTSGLVGTYPFISSSIFDENGIFVGTNIQNNSLIFLDRYNNEKYKNANICILGTSGAGKSFYTKLLIIRNRLLDVEQYIIDPEREYLNLCKNIEGTVLKIGPNSGTYINIFDIREDSLEEGESGYLATKIIKLIGFFNLIYGELNEEEKAIIEEKIIELYKRKNITFDDESLFLKNNNDEKIFKNENYMPILGDLYNLFLEDKRMEKYRIKLLPFVEGSLKFFNKHTNVEINNKLILADVYELGEDNLKYGMYLFTELFWDKIKKDRNKKKAIYLDEIWRLIGVTSNKNVAGFIYKIFKTIRKYGGSAVAITQDISDLFSFENGAYGRSILNNSSIKNIFCLEEENIKLLEEYLNISEKEKIEIKSLKKGECLMIAGEDHLLIKIDSSDFENKIINGGN